MLHRHHETTVIEREPPRSHAGEMLLGVPSYEKKQARKMKKESRHRRHQGPVTFGDSVLDDVDTYLPRIDIHERADTIEVDMDLPGVPKERIHIEHNQGVLTVWGDRDVRPELQTSDRTWHMRERRYGRFKRMIQLPAGVDHNLITAVIKDGVLSLTIPRPRVVQQVVPPRQIAVL